MNKHWYEASIISEAISDPYVGSAGELVDVPTPYHLMLGEEVHEWTGQAWVQPSTPDDDGDPEDVLQTRFYLPIYSKRLQNELSHVDITDMQYLPLHVRHYDGAEIAGFAIANVLDNVAAFDFQRSRYRRYPDDYFMESKRNALFSIQEAVLRSDAIAGRNIVRLQEFRSSIFVSELFVSIFTKNQFTGYSFSEVEIS